MFIVNLKLQGIQFCVGALSEIIVQYEYSRWTFIIFDLHKYIVIIHYRNNSGFLFVLQYQCTSKSGHDPQIDGGL